MKCFNLEIGTISTKIARPRFLYSLGMIDGMRFEDYFDLAQEHVSIPDIELNHRSRDDIPKTLIAIQRIYCDEELRTKILALMEKHFFQSDSSHAPRAASGSLAGQPRRIKPRKDNRGITLWAIFVLGVLKQSLKCNDDHLHELARKHRDVRDMLALGDFPDSPTLSSRAVARNVALLTPDLVAAVNRLAVEAGHKLVGYKPS